MLLSDLFFETVGVRQNYIKVVVFSRGVSVTQ
jgi:hypothetical protein